MKLDYLNALKGLAIIGVVLVHSPIQFEGISPYIQFATQPGKLGCQLFFLISGYLMVGSWERTVAKQSGFQAYLSFIKKRALSIAPVFILAILFYQLFSLFVTETLGESFFYNIVHDPYSIILNILLLNGLDVINFNSIVPGGWFIGTIMLFYIIFPFIYAIYSYLYEKMNVSAFYIIPIFAVALSFVIQYYIAFKFNTWDFSKRGTFLYYSIINQLPCMLVGITIAFKDKKMKLQRMPLWRCSSLFSILFCISIFVYFYFRKSGVVTIFFPLLISFSYYYLFLLFKYYFGNFPKFLIKLLLPWGKISYAAYFSNFIGTMMVGWLFSILFSNFNPNLWYFILLVPMFLVTYYLALPINRMLDWFSSKI